MLHQHTSKGQDRVYVHVEGFRTPIESLFREQPQRRTVPVRSVQVEPTPPR